MLLRRSHPNIWIRCLQVSKLWLDHLEHIQNKTWKVKCATPYLATGSGCLNHPGNARLNWWDAIAHDRTCCSKHWDRQSQRIFREHLLVFLWYKEKCGSKKGIWSIKIVQAIFRHNSRHNSRFQFFNSDRSMSLTDSHGPAIALGRSRQAPPWFFLSPVVHRPEQMRRIYLVLCRIQRPVVRLGGQKILWRNHGWSSKITRACNASFLEIPI
jgi:hypothetical protein